MNIILRNEVSTSWFSPQLLAVIGNGVLLLGWGLFSVSTLVVIVGLLLRALAVWPERYPKSVQLTGSLAVLETPFLLAQDSQIFQHYQVLMESLLRLSQKQDPIYHEIALGQEKRQNRLRDDDLAKTRKQMAVYLKELGYGS